MWHDMQIFPELLSKICEDAFFTCLISSGEYICFHRLQAVAKRGIFQTLLNVSHRLWICNLEPVQHLTGTTAELRTQRIGSPVLFLFLIYQTSHLSNTPCWANSVVPFSLLSPHQHNRKWNWRKKLWISGGLGSVCWTPDACPVPAGCLSSLAPAVSPPCVGRGPPLSRSHASNEKKGKEDTIVWNTIWQLFLAKSSTAPFWN